MVLHAQNPICSTSPYKPYLPLSAFSPAHAYCSILHLFHEGRVQIDQPDCRGESHLCTLLSYLQAGDPKFARGVCCCIGECHKSKSTLISIATNFEPDTSSASLEVGSTVSTSSIQSESSGISTNSQTSSNSSTSSPPSPGRPLSASKPSRESLSSSSLSSPRLTSHTHTSTTMLTSRESSTTSSTVIPRTASSPPAPKTSLSHSHSQTRTSSRSSPTPSSTAPRATSYSTCATCSYPTPTAACTAINGYERYYSGHCSVENTDNPGNIDPLYPPIYSTYPGTLNACDAAATCALRSEEFDPNVYNSFDLHYLCSNSSWICVQYFGVNFHAARFDVRDFDAVVAYGYYSLGHRH